MVSLDSLVLPFLELRDSLVLGPFVLVIITAFQFFFVVLLNAGLLPLLFLMGLIRYLRAWGLFKPTNSPPRVLKPWHEHIIVVTGGSSGIGHELVSLLAKKAAGVQIVILDLKPPVPSIQIPPADDAKRNGESRKLTTVHYFGCDVGNKLEIEKVWSKIITEIGHPTVIVNNAGRYSGKSLEQLSLDDIESTIQTNLTAQLFLAKLAIGGMIAQRYGHVICISSLLGHVPSSHVTDYSASKRGVVGFHEALHAELAFLKVDHLVRTTCISSGHVRGTNLFRGFHYKYPWLTPSMSAEYVASLVYRQLAKEFVVHETILVPVFAKFANFVPLLPYYVTDFLNELLGGNEYLIKTCLKRQ